MTTTLNILRPFFPPCFTVTRTSGGTPNCLICGHMQQQKYSLVMDLRFFFERTCRMLMISYEKEDIPKFVVPENELFRAIFCSRCMKNHSSVAKLKEKLEEYMVKKEGIYSKIIEEIIFQMFTENESK